jgi:hypothetical protein
MYVGLVDSYVHLVDYLRVDSLLARIPANPIHVVVKPVLGGASQWIRLLLYVRCVQSDAAVVCGESSYADENFVLTDFSIRFRGMTIEICGEIIQ